MLNKEVSIESEREIAQRYKEFYKTAVELTNTDITNFPLEKNETKRERYLEHMIMMVEMYSSRFANNEDLGDGEPVEPDFHNQN